MTRGDHFRVTVDERQDADGHTLTYPVARQIAREKARRQANHVNLLRVRTEPNGGFQRWHFSFMVVRPWARVRVTA